MPVRRTRMLRLAVLVAAAVTALPTAGAAQRAGARASCFRPRPPAACRGFWVAEAGVYPRVAGGEAPRPWGARRQLGNHASWELGYMASVGAASALGGAGFAGGNGAGARWGAKARYRRWLPGGFAADAGAGPVSAVAALPVAGAALDPVLFARGAGVTGDVGLSWRGLVGLTVRGDALRVRGTGAHAVYVGAHLESGAAVAGTVGAALAAAAALGALAYGGGG